VSPVPAGQATWLELLSRLRGTLGSCLRGVWRRSSCWIEVTRQLIDIGTTYGFFTWLGNTRALPFAMPGEPASPETLAGLAQESAQRRGAAWRQVVSLCTLAEACLIAGCLEEGRRALASIGETDRQAFCGAEVLRSRAN
jgi:hypothetical protein